MASSNHVGPRSRSEQCGVIGLAIAEHQRESTLERGHAIHSPAANQFVRAPIYSCKKSLALAEGQIENVTDRQPLRYILRR